MQTIIEIIAQAEADNPMAILALACLVAYMISKDMMVPLIHRVLRMNGYAKPDPHVGADEFRTAINDMKERLSRIEVKLVGMQGEEGGGIIGDVVRLRQSRHELSTVLTALNGRLDAIHEKIQGLDDDADLITGKLREIEDRHRAVETDIKWVKAHCHECEGV